MCSTLTALLPPPLRPLLLLFVYFDCIIQVHVTLQKLAGQVPALMGLQCQPDDDERKEGSLGDTSCHSNCMSSTQAQDPTAFSPVARTAMKEALQIRYTLLPFLYSLFHRAHLQGDTVIRPLFFE